jgi:hypothetical protein
LSVNVPHGIAYFANNQRLVVQRVIQNRAPTTNDWRGFKLMDEWCDSSSDDWYKLLSLDGNQALWVLQSSTPSSINQIDADVGNATPLAGVVNLLGGTGANTTASGNTVIVNVTGGGYEWVIITTATKTINVNEAYFSNRGGGITFSLPTTSAVGDGFRISGVIGLWTISQSAGQFIRLGNVISTTGVGGSVSSTMVGDSIHLICNVANTGWQTVDNPVGVLSVI